VVADLKGPGEEEDEGSEHVAEALLSGDAEHNPGEARPDEHVVYGESEPSTSRAATMTTM